MIIMTLLSIHGLDRGPYIHVGVTATKRLAIQSVTGMTGVMSIKQ